MVQLTWTWKRPLVNRPPTPMTVTQKSFVPMSSGYRSTRTSAHSGFKDAPMKISSANADEFVVWHAERTVVLRLKSVRPAPLDMAYPLKGQVVMRRVTSCDAWNM